MSQPADDGGPGLELEFVSRVRVDLGGVTNVGTGPLGDRRHIPILGGTVVGSRLSGTIEPGGADWQVVSSAGVAVIDTRYVLATDDGAHVLFSTTGRRVAPPDVLERLLRGETVDAAEYYFRLAVHLESGDPRYAWVNEFVFVASASRGPGSVAYELYRVL